MPRSKYQPINDKPLPRTQESQGNSGKVNTVLSALNLVPRLCRFPFHAFGRGCINKKYTDLTEYLNLTYTRDARLGSMRVIRRTF
jgi:hypothetical protein